MKESPPERHIPSPKKETSEVISPETGPKLEFKFYYTPHAFEGDFEKLAEIFPEADIYVPEVPGWDLDTAQLYNDIAQGVLEPREVAGDRPVLLKELEIIYGSKKPIFFVDILGDLYSKLNEKREEFEKEVLDAKSFFLSGRFDEAISLARECAKGLANIQIEREDFIRRAIVKAVPKMVKQHPDIDIQDKLKSGRPLKVLLSLGAVHTRIYHKLKQVGVNVEREFSESPLIFPHWHELERSYIFDKEPSDELVARGLLEVILSRYIDEFSKSSQESSAILRKLVSQLSVSKIQHLSEQVGVLGKNFIDALAQEGVRVPRSRHAFEELLEH